MTAIETLVQQPAAQAIGWALLQFVWQGALIGLLTAIALAALRRSDADIRYVVAAISLSLMLTMPVVTVLQAWNASVARSPAFVMPAEGINRAAGAAAGASIDRGRMARREPLADLRASAAGASAVPVTLGSGGLLDRSLPILLLVWLIGVSILSLRLMSGWVWVQRLKTHGAAPVGDAVQRLGVRLTRHLHISRRVGFLESTIVDVPTVIGWLKPVVLLPASALGGLAPQQLEAILAHELAHIRRHDYLVNLLQTLVETLLFYHPAVWWVSRRIRIEREHCCDDLAIGLCGDRIMYAQALADLEQLRGVERRFAMAATGGSLLHRVRRVLGAPTHAGRGPGWLAGGVSILLLFTMAAIAGGTIRAQDTPPVRQSPLVRAAAVELQDAARELSAGLDDVRDGARQLRAEVKGSARELRHEVKGSARQLRDGFEDGLHLMLDQIRGGAHQLRDLAVLFDWQEPPAPPEPPVPPVPPAPPELPSLPDRAIEVMVPPAPPAPPAQPAPPALPAPPAPPAPPAAQQRNGQSGSFTWSRDGQKLEVRYRGQIEFTDDDTDVRSVSPGGWFRIKEGGWFGGRSIEIRADSAGKLERRFRDGNSEKPFEPDGRRWLSEMLPRFIRQTGIGASRRVARIMKAKGAQGVLAEISLIEGSFGKRVYFAELFKTPGLDAKTVQLALAQAGREMDSDFELASLLIAAAGLLTDDATRKAYLDAARTIGSDFEMRRVFSSVLEAGPVAGALLSGVLETSTAIDSDFEQASLLVQIAKAQPLDAIVRAPFFKALVTVESDFEHRRVLTAVVEAQHQAPEVLASVLESVLHIEGDFEAATLLVQVAQAHAVEGALRAPFFRAADAIGSPFERGRVLQAVAKRSDASPDTILRVLRSAGSMGGNFEASQVLLAVARAHALTGEARQAYIDAAERLGNFEQGQVLAALVKSERRQ